MGYQLGIDLGTTYTAAAVSRASDHARRARDGVARRPLGAGAPRCSTSRPTDRCWSARRPSGGRRPTRTGWYASSSGRWATRSRWWSAGGRTRPTSWPRCWLPWVVQRVAEREGGPARRIALTHPASWGPHKKDLLHGALAARGLNVTSLAEPQAAALSYAAAERVERGSTIAVYDLGGGTFDSAVVRKNGTPSPCWATPRASIGSAGWTSTTWSSRTSATRSARRSTSSTPPTRPWWGRCHGCAASARRPRKHCRPTPTCGSPSCCRGCRPRYASPGPSSRR